MTEYAGKLRRHDPCDDRKVRMTDPAGCHTHQNLVAFRRVDGDLFHAQTLVVLVTDRCPQLPSPTYRSVGRICAEKRRWQPRSRCVTAPGTSPCARWHTCRTP